jgi:hypothetical protein
MNLYNQFVINPDKFRVPQYSIGPFSTEWIRKNHEIIKSDSLTDRKLLHDYFGKYVLFRNGRTALYNALSTYNLSKEDEVWILTTSGSKYISSCVTNEIEKICKWNRQFSDKTRLILVNHEFGTVYKQMEEILKFNMPIIEDMAMSMFSTDINRQTGNYGDFTIYSLSKFFPLQWGGLLKINTPYLSVNSFKINEELTALLDKLLSFYLLSAEQIKQKRIMNHEFFQLNLHNGFESYFTYQKNEIPAVYMCSSSAENLNLDGLKIFLQQNGIESSIFYNEKAFFVPVHQNLNEEDILFITSLIKYYCNENR